MKIIAAGNKKIYNDGPVFFVAEIGINHNGDIELAKKLIDVAHLAGCDAVKFQKRTPEKCVPEERKNIYYKTPWGDMTYLEYRKKVEFSKKEYDEINRYCKKREIMWSASAWDIDSLVFLRQYDLPFYKVPSAVITNKSYLQELKNIDKPIFLSTGASDLNIIEKALNIIGKDRIVLLHCTSTYPAKTDEINLKAIKTLKEKFDCLVGYSGHEVGLQISIAAAAFGASVIERHITLDRSMWGTDQAASVEPRGLIKLVRDIRVIEKARGDGNKRIYESEMEVMKKLRKV